MSVAIDRLLAIARAEGDMPSTERDAVNGAMVHTMTRPMSEKVADAAVASPPCPTSSPRVLP